VQQEAVGDLAQARHRLVIVRRERFVGEVAGGHHERPRAQPVQQQDVQRRVGQHDAVHCRVRRDRVREWRIIAPVHEHDRRLGAGQQRLGDVGDLREAADGREVGRHHCQRLGLAVLALAQPPHGRVVVRVAGEVEAAEAFDRDDPPRPQKLLGCGDGLGASALSPSPERRGGRGERSNGGEAHPRPALRARHRLGVVAAIVDVLVFSAAGVAHRERAHRGLRAVVGHALDDREARAAVGAVDERVAEAPVGRVAQLTRAVGTDRHVGGDVYLTLVPAAAGHDRELRRPERFKLLDRDRLDHRDGGRVGLDSAHELIDRGLRALDFDFEAARDVQRGAGEAEVAREAMHVRPEAHALHDALHGHAAADGCRCVTHISPVR